MATYSRNRKLYVEAECKPENTDSSFKLWYPKIPFLNHHEIAAVLRAVGANLVVKKAELQIYSGLGRGMFSLV